MPDRLFRLYQRKRVVNINANILAAGLLALIPTAGVVWIAEQAIGTEHGKWFFSFIAIGADVLFDVALYYMLHWVANHWRPVQGRTDAERRALEAKPAPFIKDATVVQIERALLSPLYYIIAGGLMHGLQVWWKLGPSVAFAIAFPCGLLVTRVLHTLWGLKTGRFRDHHEMPHNRETADDGAKATATDAA